MRENPTGDLPRNGGQRLGFSPAKALSASFRPRDAVTIAPTLGYRAQVQEWSGVRVDAPSASLALHYTRSQRLPLSAIGNYSVLHSSDGLVDLETVGGKGVLAWDVDRSSAWTTRLSLEAGLNRQFNRLLPSAHTDDLSGVLCLVLAPL